MASQIVECVPNFSEGRDRSVIDAISGAISGVPSVTLLDVDPGADTNRTVYTFVGPPEAVAAAALAAARVAYRLIDMAKHEGAHPRIGALDVCPFVPVSGIDMRACAALARKTAEALAAELGIPVYLYEAAATRPERTSLAEIRAGEYEGLPSKLASPEWIPDYGPRSFVPRWGATVVGAREFLIAYNVNLNTRDKRLAHEVALSIREAGRTVKDAAGNPMRDADGKAVKAPGRLKAVRAIGWYIESYRCAQVSINLLDYKATPLHDVFEAAKEEAERLGLLVTGGEIVGLVPKRCLIDAGRHFLGKMGKSPGASDAELVETSVRSMGLDSVSPFDPAKKIVEYACRPPAPLAASSVAGFIDEVSGDSPTPGGGSAAALAGSLGAALAAMVAGLSFGKRGVVGGPGELSDLGIEAHEVKEALRAAIDEDAAAFDAVLAASRLPKGGESQRAEREQALQAAYLRAATVPLATAEAALRALRLCGRAVALGNSASISDAGVGALLASAGVEGAALNVFINLRDIRDEAAARELGDRARAISEEGRRIAAEILAKARAAVEGRPAEGEVHI